MSSQTTTGSQVTQGGPVDLTKLSQYKDQIDKMNEQKKAVKLQYDEIENRAVELLLGLGVRYVDQSGNGSGPFWTLSKATQEGSWKQQTLLEFFTNLTTDIYQHGKRYTPEQCVQLAQKFLKSFEKRKLKIAKLTQARLKTVEDLKLWLAGKDEPPTS